MAIYGLDCHKQTVIFTEKLLCGSQSLKSGDGKDKETKRLLDYHDMPDLKRI